MKSSLIQAVKDLSPSERASLLRNIQAKPLSDDSQPLDLELRGFVSTFTPIENIAEELEKDLADESFWRRFLLRLMASFAMKSTLESYRDYRLSGLVTSSGRGSLQGLVDLTEKRVKNTVFRKIYQIYRQSQGLMPFFSCSTVQDEGIAGITFELLEKKILTPKEALSDFLNEQEILDIFKTVQKSDAEIRNILAEKVQDYLATIHPQVFEEMEGRLESFTLTRLFVLFPYRTLMSPFVGDMALDSKTEEELNAVARGGASFSSMVRPLERLYAYLNLYSSMALDFELFNKSFELYYREVASNMEVFAGIPEETFKEDQRNKVIAFYNNVKLLQKTLPIDILVKIFKQDPYYTIEEPNIMTAPRISEFYANMLETGLMGEWKISTKEIARKYWFQEVTNFLSVETVRAIEDVPSIYEGEEFGNLPSWGQVTLLHFFLEKYTDSLFSYFLKTLMHVVLVNKITYRNEIELQEATLGEFSKIERLTHNNFIKERREIFRKLGSGELSKADQKTLMDRWLSTVEVRNQKMLEDFTDFFGRLKTTFANIQKAPDLSSVMNISYTLNGHKITITEALNICSGTIDKYFALVDLYEMKDKA